MTSFNHVLTGAVIAAVVKKPELVLPLALISHFVVDIIPHWNHTLTKAHETTVNLVELVITLAIIVGLLLSLETNGWLLVGAMFLAAAPDLMWLPDIWYGKLPPMKGPSLLHRLRRWHEKIQWSETPAGLLVEAIWFILMIVILIIIR